MADRRPAQQDRETARQGRMLALVVVVAGLAAILAPAAIQVTGLPTRYEFLIYLASMAGFAWALVVSFQIWRKRRSN